MDRPILNKDRLDRSVINKRGIALNQQQVGRLVEAVTGSHPQPHWSAACFDPRHAFVFYNAARKPVA